MSLSQTDRAPSLLTRILSILASQLLRQLLNDESSLFKRLFCLLNSTSHALNRVIGTHSPYLLATVEINADEFK